MSNAASSDTELSQVNLPVGLIVDGTVLANLSKHIPAIQETGLTDM